MRLFVAVKISEELQEEILEWEKSHRKLSRFPLGNRGSSMRKSSGPVRWLAGRNLHITLIPPREEEGWEETAEKLKSLKGTVSQFGIEFNKVEYGPHSREPRLIWAEGRPPKILLDLKEKLELLLGRRSDYYPWLMHLTLARFRPETFSSFPVKQLREEVYWLEQVTSVILMKSHLLPDGAEYEILEEIKL